MAVYQTLSLFSILCSPYLTEGVITNISVIQIPQWFFSLTPYEAVFAGLTFLWICMLGYIGVIPMNLNNLFYGSPSGKRKRRELFNSQSQNFVGFPKTETVTTRILTTLRRLDKDDCVPRTLCELEHQTTNFEYKPPRGIQQILNGLKWSRLQRGSSSNSTLDIYNDKSEHGEGDGLGFYEDAVNTGYTAEDVSTNSTSICRAQYSSCSITIENILNFVSTLHFDEL